MKGLLKKITSAAVAVILACSSGTIFCAAQYGEKLTFGSDGKFTILQIADTQDDQNPAYDLIRLVKLAVEQAQPDLVVFTGDNVEDSRIGDVGIDAESWREGVCVEAFGKTNHEATLDNARAAVDAVFKIVDDAGIPFAVTQGNNDYSSGVSNEEWLEIYSSYENCLVLDESNDSDGRIDYDLGIYSSDGQRQLFNLYMMDTRSSAVTDEQIEWYENQSAAVAQSNGGAVVPAFVFQHIPVPEVGNLFEPCKLWDEGACRIGTKYYRLSDNARGYYGSAVEPGQTSSQFESWKRMGDVVGAYFGHWHTEGYTGTYDSIELGLTFGAEFAKLGPHGVRVITLDENNISDYENELYIYRGGALEKFEDSGYTVRRNVIKIIFEYFQNIFRNILLP